MADHGTYWYRWLLRRPAGTRSGGTAPGAPWLTGAAGWRPLLIRADGLYGFHKIKGRSAIFLPAISGTTAEVLGFDVDRSIDAVVSQLRSRDLPTTAALALRAGAAAELGHLFRCYYQRTPFLVQADAELFAPTVRLAAVRDLSRLQDSIRRSIAQRVRQTITNRLKRILRHDLLLVDGALFGCGEKLPDAHHDDIGYLRLPSRILESCKQQPLGSPAEVIFEPLQAALQPIVERAAKDLGRRADTLRSTALELARDAPRPEATFYQSRSRVVRWQEPNRVLIEARSTRPWAIRRGTARYGFEGYAIEVAVDINGKIFEPRVRSPLNHSYVSAEGTGRVCIPMLSLMRHRWRRQPTVEIAERILRATEQILLLGATANPHTPLQGWHLLRSRLLAATADIPQSRTFTASGDDDDDPCCCGDDEDDSDIPF